MRKESSKIVSRITQPNQTEFLTVSAADIPTERHAIDRGIVIYCRRGSAVVTVNFDSHTLGIDNVITLFPHDIVLWNDVSHDFEAEVVSFTPNVLREASMQVEDAVYRLLREDRVCNNTHISINVAGTMMEQIRYYYEEQHCDNVDRIITLLLSAFFLGFFDYARRLPKTADSETSTRTNELFNEFMALVEAHHRRVHDVASYAEMLCITPKYLGMIVQRKTKQTPKKIIDEYLILQIKLYLRSTNMTVQQIAAEFNFTDASFFIRYFKAHTDLSPQAYRKQGAQTNK